MRIPALLLLLAAAGVFSSSLFAHTRPAHLGMSSGFAESKGELSSWRFGVSVDSGLQMAGNHDSYDWKDPDAPATNRDPSGIQSAGAWVGPSFSFSFKEYVQGRIGVSYSGVSDGFDGLAGIGERLLGSFSARGFGINFSLGSTWWISGEGDWAAYSGVFGERIEADLKEAVSEGRKLPMSRSTLGLETGIAYGTYSRNSSSRGYHLYFSVHVAKSVLSMRRRISSLSSPPTVEVPFSFENDEPFGVRMGGEFPIRLSDNYGSHFGVEFFIGPYAILQMNFGLTF